jgi:hypothetical protein
MTRSVDEDWTIPAERIEQILHSLTQRTVSVTVTLDRAAAERAIAMTSTIEPLVLPINSRPIGEFTEIFPLVVSGFWLSNDLPHLFLVGILIDVRYRGSELDRIARQLWNIDPVALGLTEYKK